MAKQWFTPDTARLALDALRPAAETLCRLYRALECARPARILPDQRVDPAYFDLVRRLYATLGEIRRCGVRGHDSEDGLDGRRPVDEDGPWEEA